MPRQPQMKIIYSSISHRDITLVSCEVEDHLQDGDTLQILQDVQVSLTRFNQSQEQKLTYPFKNLQVHVLVDRGITFLCVTERYGSIYLPFAFLTKVRDQFSEQPSLISRSFTAGEYEFDRDFRPVLVSIVEEFNSGRADKMSAVEEQIEDVKQVMLNNVEKIISRGERLEDLRNKTEELEARGQEFRSSARVVMVQARCGNLKLWLLIGALITVLSIIIVIITLYSTGVIKS